MHLLKALASVAVLCAFGTIPSSEATAQVGVSPEAAQARARQAVLSSQRHTGRQLWRVHVLQETKVCRRPQQDIELEATWR